ncbi:MAG: AAA family ATPase [Candidatus Altiarchaeales archaeon]|nr:AAA family ATPase [Candidatus Altiarchaeales archaeon]
MYGIEYRPVDFGTVLGLDDAKEILQAYLRQDQYDPAYLFAGSHATGKTTLGRIFASSILCENRKEDMSPCNECSSCKQFLQGNHPGYIEYDSALSSNKENVQRIVDSLQYEIVTRYKIILFDEAHNLSKEAKEVFLKQLEKESNIILIFCTTEYDKMPETLRSRCIQFQLHEPTEQNVCHKLEAICKHKGFEYESEALTTIVRATGRHYRDAENRLRQISFLGPINQENVKKATSVYVEEVIALLLNLSYDLSKALQLADFLVSKMNIKMIYNWILCILNDTIKRSSGVSFSGRYDELLKMMQKQYSSAAYEILDYVLSRSRLNDITLFQSDLLIIHYKFLCDALAPKELKDLSKKENLDESKSDDSKNESDQGGKSIKDIHALPRGHREDAVREYRLSRRKEGTDDTLNERVGEAWGPEEKGEKAPLIHRTEISRKEFRKVLEGTLDDKT